MDTPTTKQMSAVIRLNADLLRDALIDFHQFVSEHLDHDSLPVSAYLTWDGPEAPRTAAGRDQVQQLVDCDDEIIREYSHLIWKGGWRLNQAFVIHNESLERTLYVKGDDGKQYVVVADI